MRSAAWRFAKTRGLQMTQLARETLDRMALEALDDERERHSSNLADIPASDHAAVVAEFDRHMDRVHEVMFDARRRLVVR